MHINFASAFQSVQASHTQFASKAATTQGVQAKSVSPRADILTLDLRTATPATYQRPVWGTNTGTFAPSQGKLPTQIHETLGTQQAGMERAALPQTITVSTYFGDTLMWTTTSTRAEPLSDASQVGNGHFSPTVWRNWEREEFVPPGPEWQAAFETALAEGKITQKATFSVGGKVVSEQTFEGTIATHQPVSGMVHHIVGGHFVVGYDEREGWQTVQAPKMLVIGEHTGIFSDFASTFDSTNPFATVGKLLGLEGTFADKASLLTALDGLIAEESDALTKTLSSKLIQAGLGDVTKKITFAEDKDGNIVIEGNISAREKRQLARLINDDPELVERIKTQKARMEVAEELRKPDEYDEEGNKIEFSLSDKKFDAARTQLLKNFLNEQGLSLDDIKDTDSLREMSGTLAGLGFPGLESELEAYFDRTHGPKASPTWAPAEAIKIGESSEEKSTAVRSLLAMKRGELSEATDEKPNFESDMGRLREVIFKFLVDEYNDMYVDLDPSMQITNFNMKIDDKGRLTITDVETWGGDPKANAQAEKVMNTWKFADNEELEEELGMSLLEFSEQLGLAILDAHDDEHGDVQEYKHHIVAKGFGYEIFSPDADRAALAEIAQLSAEIGSALGDFFGKQMGIESPFSLIFGNDGLFSLGNAISLTSAESQAVKDVLDELNAFLRAEEAGEDTEGMLSPQLTGIGEKFLALKAAQDRIHDKSLLPKDGVRFGVN